MQIIWNEHPASENNSLFWVASDAANKDTFLGFVCQTKHGGWMVSIKDRIDEHYGSLKDAMVRMERIFAESTPLLTWEYTNVGQCSHYHVAFLCDIRGIFFIEDLGSETSWRLTCQLPGIYENVDGLENVDIAKAKAEEVLRDWLQRANLRTEDCCG